MYKMVLSFCNANQVLATQHGFVEFIRKTQEFNPPSRWTSIRPLRHGGAVEDVDVRFLTILRKRKKKGCDWILTNYDFFTVKMVWEHNIVAFDVVHFHEPFRVLLLPSRESFFHGSPYE
eukprot:s873_g29.t1